MSIRLPRIAHNALPQSVKYVHPLHRVINARERARDIAVLEAVVDRHHRPIRARNHEEPTQDEERRVHRHEQLPRKRAGSAPIVPHPHVRLCLDTDERAEQGADEAHEVVEEGDGLGDDE